MCEQEGALVPSGNLQYILRRAGEEDIVDTEDLRSARDELNELVERVQDAESQLDRAMRK